MNTSYEARVQRTVDAIAMRPVDKIPVSFNGPAYLAKQMGLTMAEAVSDFPKAIDAAVSYMKAHPGIDTMHTPIVSVYAQPTLWYSPVSIPGEQLDENALWQLEEQEIIRYEDYETILQEGFGPWSDRVMKERLGDPFAKMLPFLQHSPIANQRLKEEAGILVVNGGLVGTPFENFCGGRTLMNFFVDLVEEPDLIKQVLDAAFERTLAGYMGMLSMKPFGTWVGGWRAAPELLSHDTWMEFVWPYLKKLVEVTVEAGVTPILHFDSCWDKELETLRELPAKKCLLMLDGTTDMRLAREVLDDRMCLMGDVPASLLAFGSASEVYDYTHKLIDDVGPRTGLIVSSGCDTPLNAKAENVDAMVQAAWDYL